MELVKLTAIEKIYGTKQKFAALKKLSITVNDGEFVSVMGKSGSGKSTMLNIIAGIDSVSGGAYLFDGADMSKLKGDKLTAFRRKNIGFIVQHFALINDFTVYDNISLVLRYEKVRKAEIRDRIYETAKRLQIEEQLKKYPAELSGGQAQRAAIARAIINNPRLLLADEPTGALDEETGNSIMKLFQSLNEKNMTIILVTHDSKLASMCGRVVYIKDGRILQ